MVNLIKQICVAGGSISKEIYYLIIVNNSLCGASYFHKWIVLPEHFEFASAGFKNSLNLHWILDNFTTILIKITMKWPTFHLFQVLFFGAASAD